MKENSYLLKDGEIVLKGLNRRSFEDVLKKNLKHALKSAGHFEITSRTVHNLCKTA